MKAAVYRRYGGADVVSCQDVPTQLHVIFDAAGRSSFLHCRAALRPAGVYLTTAASLPILLQMGWTGVFGGRKAVVAFTGLRPAGDKRRDLAFIRELAEASALAGVVDADYPLARIGDAYARVDAGHKKGNVVVTMTGAP